MLNSKIKKDYKTLADRKDEYLKHEGKELITWCAGCGNYSIQKALERALVLEDIKVKDTLFCYDIGCNGNGADKIGSGEIYTLHGLHGRVIPLAAGAALTNSKIKVIAEAGDGGTMGEGINHLIHAVRHDYPMLFILHNNENYGLTTGQASACTRKGHAMNGTVDGVDVEPMNTCDFVLNLKPSFVARTFSGDTKHMTTTLQEALKHNGFAFVEILQVCPTYNKFTPEEWYKERVNYLKTVPKTLEEAKTLAKDLNEKINIGILYKKKDNISHFSKIKNRSDLKTDTVDEVKKFNIKDLIKQFK